MWACAPLALLTRYAGIGLLAVPLIVTLLRPRTGRNRLGEAALGLILAAVPAAMWMARNLHLTGSATNRKLSLFLPPAWWEEVGRVVGSWFVPGRVVAWLEQNHLPAGLAAGIALVVLVGLAVVHRARSGGRRASWSIWIPLAALMGGHLVVIGLSSWTSYPPPDINTRTMATAFAGLLVLIAGLVGVLGRRGSSLMTAAVAVASVAFLGFKVYASRDVVQRLERDGQGYNSAAWSRSPVVKALQELAPSVVYANDTGAVYYFTGRYAYEIPHRYDSITGHPRGAYRGEDCLMRTRLRADGGILVLFAGASSLPESAATEAIIADLAPVMTGPEGGVYRDGGEPVPECGQAGSSGRSGIVSQEVHRISCETS
jgi:hypothetical protein